MLVVGSLMTWISVDLGFRAFSAAGIETTDGKLTLAAGIVLGLGDKIDRDPVRPGRVVGHDKNLAGPGDRVDVDDAGRRRVVDDFLKPG